MTKPRIDLDWGFNSLKIAHWSIKKEKYNLRKDPGNRIQIRHDFNVGVSQLSTPNMNHITIQINLGGDLNPNVVAPRKWGWMLPIRKINSQLLKMLWAMHYSCFSLQILHCNLIKMQFKIKIYLLINSTQSSNK